MGAQYFLGRQLLGISGRPPRWSDSEVSETSVGFMCGTCGECWGRAINDRATRWTFQMRDCAKHGNGSFIAAWANQFEELPPEVLSYELQIRLDKFKGGSQG